MQRKLALLILLFSVCLLAVDDKKAIDAQDRPPGVAILERVRDITNHFSDEERALALLGIADAFDTVDPSQVEGVALEVFYFSRKNLQPGALKAATEKNALTKLAMVNPAQAANLYKLQDLPNEDPKVSEDRRSYGARVLFQRLWEVKGFSALPQIQDLANWLGETGQYPYPAIAPVIKKLSPADAPKAEELFQDAVLAFRKDPGFAATNRQFVLFLLDTHDLVSKPVMQNAIEQALAAIKRASEETKLSRRIQITTKNGTYAFDSEANYLVYRLMPVMNEIRPEWAAEVLQKYPGVSGIPQAPLDSPIVTASAVSFGSTPASGAMQNALDENRLAQLATLAQNDPAAALQSANLISDPGLRSVALASLQKESPAVAPEADLQKRLDSMPNTLTKLRLLVTIGCRTTQGDEARVRRYASQALDFGTELFSQDLRSNPGKLSYQGNGYDPLVSLASCYGNNLQNTSWMETQIWKSSNELLDLHMLIALAKASALAKPAISASSAN